MVKTIKLKQKIGLFQEKFNLFIKHLKNIITSKKFKNIVLSSLIVISIFLSIYLTKNPIYKYISIPEISSSSYNSLEKDKLYEKDIKIISNYVNAFQINAQWTDSRYELFVKIYDDKDTLIYSNVFERLSKGNNILLLKEPILNKADKTFRMELEMKSPSAISLLNDKNNNIYTEQITRRNTYWIVSVSFIMLILSSTLLFVINTKKRINKQNKFIIPIIKYFSYFSTWVATACLYLYFLYSCGFIESINLMIVLGIDILIIISSYLLSNILRKHYKGLCTLFILIAVPICSLYCVLFMPGDGQDEVRHYARAYSITNGEIFTTDYFISAPKDVKYYSGFENVKVTFSKMLEDADYEYYHKTLAAPYVPWIYMLSAPVIFIFKKLGLNLFIGWYAAKIFTFLISMILSYFIIKKVPKKYQLLFFLYILIPMNVYQYTTLSGDTLINFAMLGLLSLSLAKYEDKTKLNKKDLLCIMLSLLFIFYGKRGYWLMAIPSFILLKDSIKVTKSGIKKILFAVGIACAIGLGWNFISDIVSGDVSVKTYENLLFQPARLDYAISHPIITINALIRYMINSFDQYAIDFIGYKFVWSKYSVPTFLASTYLLLIIISCFTKNKVKEISNKSKYIFIICSLISFGFIVFGFYVQPDCSNTVTGKLWGVQGRYFYPIYIVMLSCLANSKLKFNKDITNIIITICCFIHLIYIYNFVYLVF